MGPIMQIVGSAIGSTMQSAALRRQAAKQEKKANEFTLKANQVVTEKVTEDPAFMLKEYLANNGMPGLTQYLQDINKNSSNQIASAENAASSGGQLLNFMGGIDNSANQSNQKLYNDSASFVAAQKSNLADTAYAWQTNYDTIARQERAKLNKVASQYQAAADLHQYDADKMDAALVTSTFSNAGSMMGGMGGMGGGGGMAGGGGAAGGMAGAMAGMGG